MARVPTDRYVSSRSLADDIERWLADEPVTALQESIVARLARWTRRHRTLTASCTMLLGTTLVALVLNTILVGREQAQTKKALQAVMAAQRERALGRIDALLTANAQALPTLIEEFAPSRDWINPRLRELLRQDLPPEQARRVRLALLPFDPEPGRDTRPRSSRLPDRRVRCDRREPPIPLRTAFGHLLVHVAGSLPVATATVPRRYGLGAV